MPSYFSLHRLILSNESSFIFLFLPPKLPDSRQLREPVYVVVRLASEYLSKHSRISLSYLKQTVLASYRVLHLIIGESEVLHHEFSPKTVHKLTHLTGGTAQLYSKAVISGGLAYDHASFVVSRAKHGTIVDVG